MSVCILKVELNTVLGNHFTITYIVKQPQPKVKHFSFSMSCTYYNLNNIVHKRLFDSGFFTSHDKPLYDLFEEYMTVWLLQN